MPPVMELEEAPPATGALSDWLRDIVESQAQTGKRLPARIIYVGPKASFSHAAQLGESVTDPKPRNEPVERNGIEWVRNLSHLASAAKLIIPGLRGMTPVEHSNLRQYYKSIYRKA
jgi:hypothetical protein